MLKSARMRKVSLLVTKDDVDRIMQKIASFGEFEPIEGDSGFGLAAQERHEQAEKAAELLRRINYAMGLIGVAEPEVPMISFKEQKDERVETIPSEIPGILEHVESELERIESDTGIAKKMQSLKDNRNALEIEFASAETLEKVGLRREDMGAGKYVTSKVGIVASGEISSILEKLEKLKCAVSYKGVGKKQTLIAVLFTDDESQDVDKILSDHGLEELQRPGKDADVLKKDLTSVEKEIETLQKKIDALKTKHGYNLLAVREIVENCDYILKGIDSLPKGKFVYLLRGWVPARMMSDLKERVGSVTKSYVLIESEPMHDDDVPTRLDNKSVFKAFEPVTKMFGLPSYHEIDPTIVMAFTFPVFFGLMFGDLGHGAMIFLAGLALMKSKGNTVLKDFGVIILLCGISAMFFGFMYGNVFGVEETILKPIWLSPSHEPSTFLVYAIMVGVIQLSAGVFLGIINKLVEREYKHLLVPFGKIALFWSGIIIVFSLGSNFAQWATSPYIYSALVGIIALMASGPLEMEGPFKVGNLAKSLLKGFFEVYETIMGFLANTISYARLFALVLVHAGLSLAVFRIADLVGNMLFGIPQVLVLIFGTIAVVGLEGVMVFLHTMRLHYYEWFNKFFSATGRDFLPLKLKQTYTNMRETK